MSMTADFDFPSTPANGKPRVALWRRWCGLFALVLVLCGCLPGKSHATCTYSSGYGMGVLTFSFGSGFTFNPEVPVGTVLASLQTNLTADVASQVMCTAPTVRVDFVGVGTPGAYTTYPTSVAGVSIRVTFPQGMFLAGRIMPTYNTYTTNGPFVVNALPVLLELVKTGPITAGGYLSGEFGQWIISDSTKTSPAFEYISMRFGGSIPIQPTIPACTVTNPNQTFSLGAVPRTSFSGVGQTGGTPVNFNISLNCAGGTGTTTTRMYMTLTDASQPGNVSQVLSLTSSSSAKGVGIQISKQAGGVVGFGPDSRATGNTNQWFITETGNGTVTIPLQAQYISTSSTMSGGSANGLMTFTMSYQ